MGVLLVSALGAPTSSTPTPNKDAPMRNVRYLTDSAAQSARIPKVPTRLVHLAALSDFDSAGPFGCAPRFRLVWSICSHFQCMSFVPFVALFLRSVAIVECRPT